jgi:hypothetical protein
MPAQGEEKLFVAVRKILILSARSAVEGRIPDIQRCSPLDA